MLVIEAIATKRNTSTAIKAEWHDAENLITQETTLRQNALDNEEAALNEGSTRTRRGIRDPESVEDGDTEEFSVRDSWFH